MSGSDYKGIHVPSSRTILSGVYLDIAGQLSATTKTTLKSIPAGLRNEGQEAIVLADRSRWVFRAGSALADTTENLVITPSTGSGRWLRSENSCVLKIPFSYANTDDQVIFTVPATFAFGITGYPFLDITTSFAGGSSSSFGISTNITGYTADGALIGVTLEAAATAGVKPCTIGVELPDLAHFHALLFIEGSAIEYNRVVSAFTSGAAYLCLPVSIATVAAA